MRNPYYDQLETLGKKMVLPYLEYLGSVEDTETYPDPVVAQRTLGDYVVRAGGNRELAVEVKTEKVYTGNLFLERYSNATRGQWFREGWMVTLKSDLLVYAFIGRRVAFSIRLPKLFPWFRESGGEDKYELKTVGASQKNVTQGYAVPWVDIPRDVLYEVVRFGEGDDWSVVSRKKFYTEMHGG